MLLEIKPGLLVNPARVELVTVSAGPEGKPITSVYIMGRKYQAPGDLTAAILDAMGAKAPPGNRRVDVSDKGPKKAPAKPRRGAQKPKAAKTRAPKAAKGGRKASPAKKAKPAKRPAK